MIETKPFTCLDCGAAGTQGRRGARRLRCDDCRDRRKREHRAGTLVRACPVCGSGEVDKGCTYCSDGCKPATERLGYAEKKALRSSTVCEGCGQPYIPSRSKGQRWCSLACGNRHKPGSGPRGGLSTEARERQRLYWQEKNRRRRAARRGGVSEPYTLAEIAERDGFCCRLCGAPVPMGVKVPEALAPTIDHVVAVSRGGDDTRANVQLAHFRCNSVKGPREVRSLSLQEVCNGAR